MWVYADVCACKDTLPAATSSLDPPKHLEYLICVDRLQGAEKEDDLSVIIMFLWQQDISQLE